MTPDQAVSRQHAWLLIQDGHYWLEDLGSRYGTRINGQNIQGQGRQQLKAGDVIAIGRTLLRPDISAETTNIADVVKRPETSALVLANADAAYTVAPLAQHTTSARSAGPYRDWFAIFKRFPSHTQGLLAFAALAVVYLLLHGYLVGRYERQTNQVLLERGTFMTLVSSGNPGAFVTAMQDFAPLQKRRALRHPSFWQPWRWGQQETPHKVPLERWAALFFVQCRPQSCGREEAGIRINLAGADLRGVDLSQVDLRGADLREARIDTSTVLSVKWRRVLEIVSQDNAARDLTEADLQDAVLREVDLSEALLQQAQLQRANLQGAKLRKTQLQQANLRDAILHQAILREATLRQAELLRADLREVNLWRADLRGADLRGADLRDAKLWRTDLRGANLRETELRGAVFLETKLHGTALHGAKLHGVNLSKVSGLTQEQLDTACVDVSTRLPAGLQHPEPCQ